MSLLRPMLVLLLLSATAAGAQERPAPSLGEVAREAAPTPAALLPASRGEPPPLTGGRVAGQLVAGVLGGVVGAAAVAGALGALARDDADGWGQLAAIGTGVVVGYPLGAAGGVHLAGSTGGQTGSLLGTLAGSAAGAGLGALLVTPTGPLGYFVLVPAGAALGFNLTRRYRDPPRSPAP